MHNMYFTHHYNGILVTGMLTLEEASSVILLCAPLLMMKQELKRKRHEQSSLKGWGPSLALRPFILLSNV